MKENERKLTVLLEAGVFLLLWKGYWGLIDWICGGQPIAWGNVLFLFAGLGGPVLLVLVTGLIVIALKRFLKE